MSMRKKKYIKPIRSTNEFPPPLEFFIRKITLHWMYGFLVSERWDKTASQLSIAPFERDAFSLNRSAPGIARIVKVIALDVN